MELLPVVRQRFFDANGLPLAGGKLYSYEAGSSTPKATYADRSGVSLNTNPVVLDANGEAEVWIGSGYFKFVLQNSAGVQQWSQDNVAIPSEAALASAFYRDVTYLTFADSPYTLTSIHNGNLISVDSSDGAVVVNLPQISSVVLPYNVAVKLTAGSNSVTVNRAGTDTLEGATSKVLATPNAAAQFIADIDKAPDQWAIIDQGTVADGAVTRVKLATGAIAVPNRRTVSTSTDSILTTDDEVYVTVACTVTLLAANNASARSVRIICGTAGIVVTVVPSGSDTIMGETSQTLTAQYDAVTFIPNGSTLYYCA